MMMPLWLKEWWPVLAVLVTVIVVPSFNHFWRSGVVSKTELGAIMSAEAQARIDQVEGLRETIATDFDQLARDHRDLSERTLRIETEIRHLPTRADIDDLKAMVSGMASEVRATATRTEAQGREIASVGAAVNRVEDFLLKRSAS